ncbi:hypothetical protein R3X27_24985 [Tropicimonas sp. TH_r6]|uniref:hypothetical protein n=1 Tax=Tropicimonas sp. TH_r6 TaxID=3082085 RepID=UPI0029530EAF|nr:hypothetical protein [Tropicimonas sp. TH_r6]MDV7145945.1 hypothetical protein [Tropicimonas sp. TH_r6]
MGTNALISAAASATITLLAIAEPASAQDTSAAQANNPLANTTALNFQNQYFGEIQGTDRDANQFYLRYAQPFQAFGGDWLMRATVPVNTVPLPGGDDETGLGDINIFAAYLFDTGNPAVSFGIGPQVTAPTATEDTLGSGKWSLGLANVLFNGTNPKFQWGYLLTWQASVGGDEDREDVNLGAFQPFGFYQLGQGWYLRSASVWTYNFDTDDYGVPLSLGIGKVIKTDRTVVNVFAEPQKYVWTSGDGQPDWGVFAGLNFQF